MTLIVVPVDMLGMVWGDVEPKLQMAVDFSNGELTTKILYDKISNKDLLLIAVTEGETLVSAVTVEMRRYQTGKKILNICCAGGDRLEEWISMMDDKADELAIQHNCDEVYVIGRNGWVKRLKSLGYSQAYTVVTRKVKGK